jgi:hypothetical protein
MKKSSYVVYVINTNTTAKDQYKVKTDTPDLCPNSTYKSDQICLEQTIKLTKVNYKLT